MKHKWMYDADTDGYYMPLTNNSKLSVEIDRKIDRYAPYMLFKVWHSIKDDSIHTKMIGRYESFEELDAQVCLWLGG